MAIAALLAGLGVWVLLGLFQTTPRSPTQDETSRLLEEKESIYRSMIELERDFDEGKVSEEDHAILQRRYERQALGVLDQLSVVGESTAGSDVLEEEIAAARKRLRGG